MNFRAVVLTVVLLGCLFGGMVAFTGSAAASEPIEIENTLAQSSSDGQIDVETRVTIPSATTRLEITLPEGSDVYETNGFRRIDDRTYEWTKSTTEPTVRYEYEGSVYGARGDREGYFFVVADEWALVRTPGIGISWETTDRGSSVVRNNVVDGDGIASTHIAYLGLYEEHTGAAAGQEFRLVVPEAADLREDPEDIIETLESASERLAIGERDSGVFVVAAPTGEHRWAPAGLQRGDGGDMWVRDAEPLGTNRDTWVHEYVHTRQQYTLTAETRWTIEGMADYYAALLSYESGAIAYDAFRDRLEEGAADEYADVRLADPATWEVTDADYDRGMLVFAHLDLLLRTEADASIDGVLAGVNDRERELTQRRFLNAIEAAGGSDIRAAAERYAETTDVPPIATRSEHVAAFGGPDIRYTVEGTAVSGPYRTGPIEGARIVTEETLELNVTVENVGTEAGAFDAALRVDGESVSNTAGELPAGERTRVQLAHAFDSAGEFEVSVGTAQLSVTVEEPADISVIELTAEPTEATAGEPVTLRATVESAADRPAAGEVVFEVDGEAIGAEPVRIGEGSKTVETTTSFERGGEYTVSAGDASTIITVDEAVEDGPSIPDPDPSTIDDMSGFGPAVAVVALVFAAVLARR